MPKYLTPAALRERFGMGTIKLEADLSVIIEGMETGFYRPITMNVGPPEWVWIRISEVVEQPNGDVTLTITSTAPRALD